MRGFLVLALVTAPALAQEQEVQRALIQRDQQSADFALRLKQSQEGVQPAPGDNRHLNERQRLENLSSQQLLEVKKDAPQELRPYERQKSADDRVLLFPPPVVRTQPPEKARPLPAPMPDVAAPIGPAY
jgi:septal ring-binding cell division protein DamX